MNFGYFVLSLLCGPPGSLRTVLHFTAFDVIGLAFWALCFTWHKPVDLHSKYVFLVELGLNWLLHWLLSWETLHFFFRFAECGLCESNLFLSLHPSVLHISAWSTWSSVPWVRKLCTSLQKSQACKLSVVIISASMIWRNQLCLEVF